MKLHIDNLDSKMENYGLMKKENKYLVEKVKKLKDNKKENEIIILKTENKNLKRIIDEKEKEIELKEKEFNQKISELNKSIFYYEEKFKYQNTRILMESENDKSVNR